MVDFNFEDLINPKQQNKTNEMWLDSWKNTGLKLDLGAESGGSSWKEFLLGGHNTKTGMKTGSALMAGANIGQGLLNWKNMKDQLDLQRESFDFKRDAFLRDEKRTTDVLQSDLDWRRKARMDQMGKENADRYGRENPRVIV